MFVVRFFMFLSLKTRLNLPWATTQTGECRLREVVAQVGSTVLTTQQVSSYT